MSRAEMKRRWKEAPKGSRSGQQAGRRQGEPVALPGPAQPQTFTNLPSASPDCQKKIGEGSCNTRPISCCVLGALLCR